MYAWFWRTLPGPVVVRLLLAALVLLAVLWLLFEVVFPWAETALPFLDASVEAEAAAGLPLRP